MIHHWLNRTLSVYRPETTADGSGGQTVTLTLQGTVVGKVDQPSASEQIVAAQAGSHHSHNIYLEDDADVERNDELRGDDQVFKVISVVRPSTPRYAKALCELVQSGPGVEGESS